MPNRPPDSSHWKTNHEYSIPQLLRFHAVNLHHHTQALASETHINPSLEMLIPAIAAATSALSFDKDSSLVSMSPDREPYTQAISQFQDARRNLPYIHNTNAKTLIRRNLVNCIYSCIAITSLIEDLHRNQDTEPANS